MPRDYKHRRKRKNDDTPGWVWGLGGLSVGLFVALAVYLQDRQNLVPSAPVANTAAIPSSAREEPEAEEPKSRFDFYEMLPRFEVVIPETEREVSATTPTAVQPVEPGLYILQAGSFQSFADADRRKAQLALLGMESQIQKVTIDERQWHRVRLGPYDRLNDVQRARRALRNADIDALILRVGERGQ